MSATKDENKMNRRTLWLLLAGVFLISFSLLAFEISLTRILSVMLSYHYVFIVISLALLGLGVGGIFVHFFRPQVSLGVTSFSSLALFASLFSLSIPLSVIVVTKIVIDNTFLYLFFLFIPFFFAGVFLAKVFRTFPFLSSRIYGADLVGAATGSLGVILLLNILGGINTTFLLGLIASIAPLLFVVTVAVRNIKGLVLSIISLLILSSLLGVNLAGSTLVDVPVGTNLSKEIHRALNAPSSQGEIIETRWSAFGRTDLVAFRTDAREMSIYIDGTAGTPMYQFNGDSINPEPKIENLKTEFPGYLPFSFLQEKEKDNALIIGPGGGRDILLALMGGIRDITVVEVNKDLVDIMREYAWYNGGIYTDFENVSVYVDEGRSFLKRQNNKYDIIMLSLPVIRTSRSLEGYALTENFLFTIDSIIDYLEHLTDEGRLIVVAHSQVEILRLLSISLAALNQKGIDTEAAMSQIFIVGVNPETNAYPVLVMRKTPFDSMEMVSIHQAIHQFGYDPDTSYLPGIGKLDPSLIAISMGVISFDDLSEIYSRHGLDINPVTDDSPFFYKFERGISKSVSQVLWVSIIMLLLVILAPIIYWRKKFYYQETLLRYKIDFNYNIRRFVVLFSMLGIGFMLVEISTIQRYILFLGQPVLSLAVLLVSLLGGAGIGSMYSGRFASEKIIKVIAVASLCIVIILFGYAFALPLVLEQLLGLDLVLRVLATVAISTPLGFLMGFPLPLSLRLLKDLRMESYIPWLWGINGISSVLGSVMSIVMAISFGFTEALLLGAGCYLVVLLVFQRARMKRVKSDPQKR